MCIPIILCVIVTLIGVFIVICGLGDGNEEITSLGIGTLVACGFLGWFLLCCIGTHETIKINNIEVSKIFVDDEIAIVFIKEDEGIKELRYTSAKEVNMIKNNKFRFEGIKDINHYGNSNGISYQLIENTLEKKEN